MRFAAFAPWVVAGMIHATPASAGIISTVGNDVIDRGNADSWSNFTLALTTETFPERGRVLDWSVYTATTGDLALLLLEQTAQTDYTVRGADRVSITTPGFNDLTFNPDTGSSAVESGWMLGLWIGDAKVDYTRGTDDEMVFCGGNLCQADLPLDGEVLSLGVVGTPGDGDDFRRYSVAARYHVPEPASIALLGLGLVALAAGNRRRARL